MDGLVNKDRRGLESVPVKPASAKAVHDDERQIGAPRPKVGIEFDEILRAYGAGEEAGFKRTRTDRGAVGESDGACVERGVGRWDRPVEGVTDLTDLGGPC